LKIDGNKICEKLKFYCGKWDLNPLNNKKIFKIQLWPVNPKNERMDLKSHIARA